MENFKKNIYTKEVYAACEQFKNEIEKIKKDKRKGHAFFAYFSTSSVNGEMPSIRVGSYASRTQKSKDQVIADATIALNKAVGDFREYLSTASPEQLYLIGLNSARKHTGVKYGGFSPVFDKMLNGQLSI